MSSDIVAPAYREARERLVAWGRGLDPELAAATPVPALPGWSVKDTFAHLVGIVADVETGTLAGVPDDETTAAQVASRAALDLPAVLDEWERRAASFDDILRDLGPAAPWPLVIDIWAHEVDMRSALGVPVPDGGRAERVLDTAVRKGIGGGWAERGVPALRIVTPDAEWTAGGDQPAGTLRSTLFELGRVMLGRRSRSQMTALDWDVDDPSPWVAALPTFGPAEIDVVDSERA